MRTDISKLTEEQAKELLLTILEEAKNAEDARDFIMWVLSL